MAPQFNVNHGEHYNQWHLRFEKYGSSYYKDTNVTCILLKNEGGNGRKQCQTAEKIWFNRVLIKVQRDFTKQ